MRNVIGLSFFIFHFSLSPAAAQVKVATPNWRDSLTVLNKEIARAAAWSTDLHLRKAAVNLELQQWEYAAEEYALVLQHEPRNLAALFYRAYANSHLRRYNLSRDDYEDFLKMVPRHLEARLGLAYVYQQLSRRTDAMNQLNRVVEQYPDSAVGYAARATLERDMLQHEAALYDWQEALRREPQNTGYVASYVDLLLQQGRKNDARQALDAAVRRGTPRGLLREWYERCQ